MKAFLHSPWFPLTLAISGMIAGYVYVVQANGGAQAAYFCPAKEACLNGECDKHEECKHGECSANCPGNCHKQ